MVRVLFIIVALCAVIGSVDWVRANMRLTDQAHASIAPDSLTEKLGNELPQSGGTFDVQGTIVIDPTDGAEGSPYILYTRYNASGKPFIETKKLVFPGVSGCAVYGMPCALPYSRYPVRNGQTVRVTGHVDAQLVYVEEFDVLSS